MKLTGGLCSCGLVLLVALVLCTPGGSNGQIQIINYWEGLWTVLTTGSGVTPCSQASCCCFNGLTNVYQNPIDNFLYFNGTVAGANCDAPVKQDNLDPPTGLTETQEFFGIDSLTFTLSNASVGSTIGLEITAVSSSAEFPLCGFTLYRQVSSASQQLPAISSNPCLVSPCGSFGSCQASGSSYTCTCKNGYSGSNCQFSPIPAYATPYAATWALDNSCDAISTTCCCLTNSVTIYRDPGGAENWFVNGTTSVGCDLGGGYEQDDFPWPSSGSAETLSVSSTVVLQEYDSVTTTPGMLSKNDPYSISLTWSVLSTTKAQATILFNDTANPQCSMKATRVLTFAISSFAPSLLAPSFVLYFFIAASSILVTFFTKH